VNRAVISLCSESTLWRSRLLAGAAAVLLAPPLVHAQEQQPAQELPPAQEAVGVTEVEVDAQKEAARRPAQGSAEGGYRSVSARVGPLGDAPILETPLSLHVTSGELIENRGAHTVSRALAANPAVATLMDSGGYTSMSRVMIRGFTAADQSDLRDGLVDRSFSFVPLENVERVEVLNGLSGFLQGFSAMGGSVDYVTKRPTPELRASLSAGQYGGGINELLADVSGPIGAEGLFGYRLIGYHEEGDTYVHFGQQRRTFLSAAADWRLAPEATLTADLWFQDHLQRGLQVYFLPHANREISADLFDPRRQFGQEWTYNLARKGQATLHLEWRLRPDLTLRAALRTGRMWREYEYVAAALTNEAGAYSESARGSPRQTETTRSAYALLDGAFELGGVRNRFTVGYTGTQYRYTRGVDVSAPLGASSAASPVGYPSPGLVIGDTTTYQSQALDDLVLGDRIGLWDGGTLQLGVNYAMVHQDAWGQSTGISMASFVQRRWTPSVGLSAEVAPGVVVYGSYMEGLASGGTAPSTAVNAGEQLPPSVSRQGEVGGKATVGDLDLTAALFRIDKVNEYTDPGDDRYKQDGREVHQGVELSATGRILRRLAVTGGATYLRARVTHETDNPSIEGKTPVNVPEVMAGAYVEWDLPLLEGLTLTGGVNFSGRRPITPSDTAYLAGAVTVDAGLRYRTAVGKARVTVIANATNLLDERYWSYFRSGDGFWMGEPRLVQVSTKVDY
jgi:iron complex outermembrane receptor protein